MTDGPLDFTSNAPAQNPGWRAEIYDLLASLKGDKSPAGSQSTQASDSTDLNFDGQTQKAAAAAHQFVDQSVDWVKKHAPDPDTFGFHRVTNFDYMLDKSTDTQKMGYGAEAAGAAVLGGTMLRHSPPTFIYAAAGGLLTASTIHDYANFSASDDSRNHLSYGMALAGDAAMAAGVITRMTCRSVPLAATVMALGAAAKITSAFIPNHREFHPSWLK